MIGRNAHYSGPSRPPVEALGRLVLALCALALTALACTASAGAGGDDIEQTYATRWNVEPIARFALDRRLTVNAARCRIDDGQFRGKWLKSTAAGTVLGKVIWRIPVDSIPPGSYSVTHDLRTPTGAQWIQGVLRVPQIARHTGAVGSHLAAPRSWPQDRYPAIACDQGPVEFGWDRENLYVRAKGPGAVEITIDSLPVEGGKCAHRIKVVGVTVVPWSEISPAAPLTGQTLRYRVDGQTDPGWTDILLVGSGEKLFFGATIVSDGPGGDDQGPPTQLLKAQMDLAGFDLHSVRVGWEDVEAADPGGGPRSYDWSGLRRNESVYKSGLVLVSINLQNHWAEPLKTTDPERYWRLAEDFVAEAVRECSKAGIRHFTLGYNEPEMFSRTDNKDYFNTHLTHCANATREANPGAVVVAGRFSSGDPNLIREFEAHGFRDNFDVLDIHTYSDDPLTGTAMGEIVASHDALDKLGMGRKRIFLGEGWGPTRSLPQVERTGWDQPVSPEEADITRLYFQNGYRCLVTARADYSPDWVLGAKYFTLNDNVGGTYWKQSARPVYGPKKELMGYMIGELRFAADSSFQAFFCNGGLIDFQGSPKGQWFYDFPPALPEVRVTASSGPDYVLVGEWHEVGLTVVNANPRPITGLEIGVRDRSGKFRGEISAEVVGDHPPESLAPGGVWRGAVRVRVDKGSARGVRWAVELVYSYDGEKHVSDDIVATVIRDPVSIIPSTARIVLDGTGEQSLTVRLRNNQQTGVVLKPVQYSGPDFRVVSSPGRIHLPAGVEGSCGVAVKPLKPQPGLANVELLSGAGTSVEVNGHYRLPVLAVVTPLGCPRVASAPRIDGDLSDWPREQVARGEIRFGTGVDRQERPSDDPFPKPSPAKESAIRRAASTPGRSARDEPKAGAYSFGADAAVAWDDRCLYLAVVVDDKTHVQRYTGADVWHEDSVQIAFDPLSDGDASARLPGNEMKVGYGPDDYEMALALTSAGPQVTVVTSPSAGQNGPAREAALAVRRNGAVTVYEAGIPWSILHRVVPRFGERFGFDILINNFEGGSRYTLGWAGGIGGGKYPGVFVPLILR